MLPEPVPPQQAAFDHTVAVRHSLTTMLFGGRLASIATWLLLICITVAALAR